VLLCQVGLVFISALILGAGRSCQVKPCIASDVALSQALAVPEVKFAKERVTKLLNTLEPIVV
jgi:hypothetical protein